ncbi:putative non-specific serine/threonine protein kinase [Helianthus annuus]|nr:putative non-specific serine/threonine protein kinase [Helianthus annuus]KAJ0929455.1 putative non-specific serine/threonine protein kinase [Helianthus annuus]
MPFKIKRQKFIDVVLRKPFFFHIFACSCICWFIVSTIFLILFWPYQIHDLFDYQSYVPLSLMMFMFYKPLLYIIFLYSSSISVQGDSKLSSNSKGNNMLSEMKEGPMDLESPSPTLKEFRFGDLRKATREFSRDLLLGWGCTGEVFLGWVEHNTLAPSKEGDGIAVAVKWLKKEKELGTAAWVVSITKCTSIYT